MYSTLIGGVKGNPNDFAAAGLADIPTIAATAQTAATPIGECLRSVLVIKSILSPSLGSLLNSRAALQPRHSVAGRVTGSGSTRGACKAQHHASVGRNHHTRTDITKVSHPGYGGDFDLTTVSVEPRTAQECREPGPLVHPSARRSRMAQGRLSPAQVERDATIAPSHTESRGIAGRLARQRPAGQPRSSAARPQGPGR